MGSGVSEDMALLGLMHDRLLREGWSVAREPAHAAVGEPRELRGAVVSPDADLRFTAIRPFFAEAGIGWAWVLL